MWTRPDAFVIAAVIIVASIVFTPSPRPGWPQIARFYLTAAAWSALLYGPWVAWAWWYYGTPVPHTIVAKSGMAPGHLTWNVIWNGPFKYLTGGSQLRGLLNPSYSYLGGWPEWLLRWEHMLAIVAGIVWLVPRIHVVARVASLALFLGSIYLQAIPIAPWYLPYWYMLAALSLAGAAEAVLAWAALHEVPRAIVRSVLAAALILQFAVVGLSAWQFRQQQRIIENSGRQVIGEWLHDNAKPDDTVFLEPLGYIGYFSQLHMLDYPGLCAPSVVSARKAGLPSFASLVQKLNPTWLVLRLKERAIFGLETNGENHAKYDFIIARDGRKQLESIPFLPGRGLLDEDAVFLVYRRREMSTPIREP
jgi:hypothetical protein